MLTGEYFVLNGAKALAIPVSKGQSMHVKESSGSEVIWTSYNSNGEPWFSAKFDLLDFEWRDATDEATAQSLRQILKQASRLNSDFLSKWKKYRVDTFLEFDRNWGFGSSSTLISCIAQWADINPYILLFNTLGGSGYDVACAQASGPILYQLGDNELHISHVDFAPNFTNKMYLVYLGQKTDSGQARKHYYAHKASSNGALGHISDISEAVVSASSLSAFEELMDEHEKIVATSLNLSTVKSDLFPDFWGSVKSLGAWGGDFALATSDRDAVNTMAYFKSKGCETVFRYEDLMLEVTA